jgi:hypothetical protein
MLREELVRAQPEAFAADLASSYGIRGAIIGRMGRHADAAAAFAQGIQAITPLFRKVPMAVVRPMTSLYNNYLKAIQLAKIPPDKGLLAPVIEMFERLKQDQPKNHDLDKYPKTATEC